MNGKFLEPEDSALVNLTEKEFTDWKKEELKADFIVHKGRYWRRSRLGFCVPIHPLARLNAYEATKPTLLSLGFRAALSDDARSLANSHMSHFILSDLAGYNIDTLPGKRRTKLRKCQKSARIVRMKGLAVPREQIYEVIVSAAARTNYWPPSKENYLSKIERHFSDERRYILVALVGDKVAGFLEGIAIGGTAYSQYLFVESEYLSTEIGTGLVFEFSQVCRRAEGIREITYGSVEPDDEQINTFKKEMGFPVVKVPIILSINSLLERYFRWRDPRNYFRVTGVRSNHPMEAS